MSNQHGIALALMANSEDATERANAAKNPATPDYLLRDLADDDDEEVRSCVARNPAVTADILRELGNDECEWVCRCVALNTKTPLDTVLSLIPCSNSIPFQRKNYIQSIFDTHQNKIYQLARSGTLNLNMICADGETLKEGLINGNQAEIYSLLLAEHLAGKTERMTSNIASTQVVPSRRV